MLVWTFANGADELKGEKQKSPSGCFLASKPGASHTPERAERMRRPGLAQAPHSGSGGWCPLRPLILRKEPESLERKEGRMPDVCARACVCTCER